MLLSATPPPEYIQLAHLLGANGWCAEKSEKLRDVVALSLRTNKLIMMEIPWKWE